MTQAISFSANGVDAAGPYACEREESIPANGSLRSRVNSTALAILAPLLASLIGCGGGSIAPAPAAPPPSTGCNARPPLNAVLAARSPLNAVFTPENKPALKRVYQPDWAGPVLFAPGQVSMKIPPRRFCSIEGEWIVPYAKPTINCSNPQEPTDGSSLWIALDGWSGTFKAHLRGKDGKWHAYDSTDILQAGSESDVPCYHGGSLDRYRTTSYFWIEWAGSRNIAVTPHHRNLTLHPGDKIYVRITADTTGPNAWQAATLWFVDETTGFYLPPLRFHSRCVDCGTPFHRRATLFGNTAEWIVEATFYSATSSRLPDTLDDFGTVELGEAVATDQRGTEYDLTRTMGATPNVDWMTWNGVPLAQNGTLLACATIEGPQRVRFARAPYAIATPGDQGKLEPKPQRC